MGFLNKILRRPEPAIGSYQDFWDWFVQNQTEFYNIVSQKNPALVEAKFFSKLAPKLAQLTDGIFYLTGMANDSTAELVLTADGNPKNIVFVEELADASPHIPNWLITKL